VGDDGGRGDPFDDIVFDEDFVRGAQHTEASAADRVERLRRIDRGHRELREDAEAQRRLAARDATRERRRGRRRPLVTAGVVVALLVAAVIVLRHRPASAAAPDDASASPPASEALTPDTAVTGGANAADAPPAERMRKLRNELAVECRAYLDPAAVGGSKNNVRGWAAPSSGSAID